MRSSSLRGFRGGTGTMTSPKGKGVFPETDFPLSVGVLLVFGGHETPMKIPAQSGEIDLLLVVGRSSLNEFLVTNAWELAHHG